MNFAKTEDMLQAPEILIPGFTQKTPAAVVYSNASAIGLKAFANRMLQHTYLARVGRFDPVILGMFPPGIRLLGGHSYWLENDGTFAIEQINPLTPDIPGNYASLTSLAFTTENIEDDCVLVARFGDVTWGHWIAEILPRAIMAEHAYPGRFRFAVADQMISDTGYGRRVLESLLAYGIALDRILLLRFDRHYRFARLHTVVNIWSAGGMNPKLMRVMRDDIATPPPSHSTGKVAILRRDTKTRNITNSDEILALLHGHNFTVVDMATQPFLNQVAFFRECETVFGVFGSGLIGLIYSPEGVNVASVAPSAWDDTYCHGLIQLRHGSHADIRCPVIWSGEGWERDAPMVVVPAHVEAGLAALAMPEAERAPDGILTVGGVPLRRHMGETVMQIDFGAKGMANLFLGEGWGHQEPNHIWSIGPRSFVQIPRPFETDQLELQVEVIALLHPDYLIARKLDVAINGHHLGSFIVSSHARVACSLPQSCLGDDLMLDICFEHPFCVSAAATGHAPDDRPLGLGFISLAIVSYAPSMAEPAISRARHAQATVLA